MQLYREFGEPRGGQVHTCLVELLPPKFLEKTIYTKKRKIKRQIESRRRKRRRRRKRKRVQLTVSVFSQL